MSEETTGIVFVPGQYYYILNQDQYNELSELMATFPGDDFLSDFEYSENDGIYVAQYGAIDEAEREFLESVWLCICEAYKKSSQSTSWF